MEITERVTKIEVESKEIRKDLDEIKVQVTNHLPTAISEVKGLVYDLREQHIAKTAVSESWDNNLKKAAIIIGCAWTVLKFIEMFR